MDKKQVQKMTLEQVVKTAIELRKAADAGEIRFIEFLMVVEETGAWRAATVTDGSFESFLTRHHICGAERYSRSRQALTELKRAQVHTVGLPAARQAIRVTDAAQREQVLDSMTNAARDSGVPLTDWTARKIVQEVTRTPRVRVSRIDELESANRALRQRVDALERENAELRERLGEADVTATARTSSTAASPRRRGRANKSA